MTSDELDAWATAYIVFQSASRTERYPAVGEHPCWWAVNKFFDNSDNPVGQEESWKAILEILSRNPSKSVLAVLAAGALEDLIEHAGPRFVDRIVEQAKDDLAFRALLQGVWESGPQDVWARVERASRGDFD